MTTPAIDFWPHLAKHWISPQDETLEGGAYKPNPALVDELIEVASDVVFFHGRSDQDLVECLFEMWGERPRLANEYIDRDEIRRLLHCIREGWNLRTTIQEGVWDHFKGGVYAVHGRVGWTGEEEQLLGAR